VLSEFVIVRKLTRLNQLYRTKKREGALPFGRSYIYENILFRSESDPYVPGTKVPRLKPLHLSATAAAVFDDELESLIEALRAHRDAVTP
jgi:hypothetical protein